MLEAGIRLVLPEQYRTVCAVERQAYPASAFVDWMEKTSLGAPPVWDDIKTFDGKPWRGVVDIITGGYPCQPFSDAGKRKGKRDPRHIWPDIRRIVRSVQPSFCFFENVRGHLTRGFDTVKSDLQEDGYRVEDGLFAASHLGASHRRERIFILAGLADSGSISSGAGAELTGREAWANSDRSCPRASVADAEGQRRPEGRAEHEGQQGRISTAVGGVSDLAHSDSVRESQCPGSLAEGRRRAVNGSQEVGNADIEGPQRRRELEEQNAKRCATEAIGHDFAGSTHVPLNEWPWPARPGQEQFQWEHPRTIESGMGRTAYGLAPRADGIHMLGNGVVPVAAAMAFVALWCRLFSIEQ
jgi:DNA (cytosine-5)-methyltransferase 1